MITPLVKTEIPVTFRDHPGVQSALFYTDVNLCNLNCFQCHNRNSFKGTPTFFSYEELEEKLKFLKLMGVELIIVSGGEPTLVPLLGEVLDFIKQAGFPVRVDTNGTFPERVKELLSKELVDGFAVDIKIPLLDEYTPDQLKRFKTILFSSERVDESKVLEYVKNLSLTIEIIEKYSPPYTVFRTVRYPLLREEEIKVIAEGVKFFPHQVNPFYSLEE